MLFYMMELSIFTDFMTPKIVSMAIVYSDIGARIIRMFLGLIELAYTKKDLFLLLDTWKIIYIVNLKNQRNSLMNG